MPGNKTRYLNFCETRSVPLHGQAWWLDAVCGPEQWDVGLAENAAGEMTGSWAYYTPNRMGLRMIRPAPLTSYGGPWLQYPANADQKLPSRYDFEQKTYSELLRQLPPATIVQQNLYPRITNGLPFLWAGYQVHTRYTYRLEASGIPLPNQMDSGTRNKILQAGRDFEIVLAEDFDRFWAVYQAANARRKWKPVDQGLLLRIDQAAQAQQARYLFIARNRNSGQDQAALYITCDRQGAYCLLSGFRPETPLNQANYLLYAEVLRFCSDRGLAFDFEGSLDPGVGHVFRKMGAQLTPYLQIWKGNRLAELARALGGK
ncbi:MAG: GNAT family N-acetyltransferase [Saprospiraceae bacterium]